MKLNFPQYLENLFLNWQMEKGGRKTMYEFADELGISYSTLSQWMNGMKEPSDKNARMLAEKFGLEIYDMLGRPRPDPDLYYIEAHWINLPNEKKKAIREEVEKYVTE